MKKLICIFTAFMLVISLVACSTSGQKNENRTSSTEGEKNNSNQEEIMDLKQYQTAYVGDVSNVTQIVCHQNYPKGYGYDHIEIQSQTKPYTLKVYLNKNTDNDSNQKRFEENADTTFSLIGNLSKIEYLNMDGKMLASFDVDDKDNSDTYPPCVMIDGVIYKETGYVDSMLKCGTADGSISSSVDGSKLPSENNQSNFGTGYKYQRSTDGQVNVKIGDEWIIFQDIKNDDATMPVQVKNFIAEVKNVGNDGTLLVSYVSMPNGFVRMSKGEYIVLADNLLEDVSIGDTVRIWFDGSVLETDPAQIGAYRIEKLK